MNAETECALIRDLMPLYHDNVCSEESRRAVEAHLKECAACRAEYQKLFGGSGAVEAAFDDEKERMIAESYKKVERKRRITIAVLSLIGAGILLAIALFAIKLYNTWPVYPQPHKNVQNTEELSEALKKDGLDLLVPDISELHTTKNYGIAIELNNRSRSAKAQSYWMSGTSEEYGYDWNISAVPAPNAWAPKDLEYRGVPISKKENVEAAPEDHPEYGYRYTTTYNFCFNGARYTVQGYFSRLGRSLEEVQALKAALSEHLFNTVKSMLDRAGPDTIG